MLTNYYSGLITKGLGLPATAGFITMHFSLFVKPYAPPVVPPVINNGGGGGGHVPVGGYRPRGAVPMRNVPINFNRPKVSVPQYYTRPRTGTPSSVIVVKVKFGGKEVTREYVTSQNKAKMAVKVIGLLTKLQERVNVIAKGLFEWINNKDRGEK